MFKTRVVHPQRFRIHMRCDRRRAVACRGTLRRFRRFVGGVRRDAPAPARYRGVGVEIRGPFVSQLCERLDFAALSVGVGDAG